MPSTTISFSLFNAGGDDLPAILFQLLIIFVAAKLAAEVFERLRQPAVVGEILVGILIGPQVLKLAKPDEIVHVLAELGVLFLLFSVGLETRPSELKKVGTPAVLAAVGGVVVPFIFGYVTLLVSGESQPEALFLGAAMVATSVGITARVLARLGVLNSEPSRIVLGAAILDDILGLLALAVVTNLAKSSGGLDVASLVQTLVASLLFVGLMLALGGKAVNRAMPMVERLRIGHSLYLGSIALCLLLSVVAGMVGVAAIIGAFLAGTALAEFAEETRLHHRIENLTEFLLPFFLVSIGMQLNLSSLQDPKIITLCVVVTILAVLGKLIGCGLPLLRQGKDLAMQVGWGMVPRGEVGIIVATIGLKEGVLNEGMYAVVLFMAVATTLIAPPMVNRTFKKLASAEEGPEGVVELEPSFSSEMGEVLRDTRPDHRNGHP